MPFYLVHELMLSACCQLHRRVRKAVSELTYSGPSPVSTVQVMGSSDGLPFYASGPIISGFGRGSKDLGIPTANYSEEVVNSLPDAVKPGVYFGFAQVDSGPVYKMAMNIGWNPYYNNTKKSMETHIFHKFDGDLYGRNLKTILIEFLRPEQNFDSLEGLIAGINNDIEVATAKLDEEKYSIYKNDPFFS